MAEVAGLALAAFSVCNELAKMCQSGIRLYKDMQNYKQSLTQFQRELGIEQCKFMNSLCHVFGEGIASSDASHRDSKTMQEQLKAFFTGREFNAPYFEERVLNMQQQLSRVAEKFKELGNGASGFEDSAKNKEGRKEALKSLKKAFKLAISKADFDEDLRKMTKINDDIFRLFNTGGNLQRPGISHSKTPRPIEKHYKRVQGSARLVFDALKQQIQATHSCGYGEHGVGLCLEQMIGSSEPEDNHNALQRKPSMKAAAADTQLRFGILVRLSGGTSATMWRELAIDADAVDSNDRIEPEYEASVMEAETSRVNVSRGERSGVYHRSNNRGSESYESRQQSRVSIVSRAVEPENVGDQPRGRGSPRESSTSPLGDHTRPGRIKRLIGGMSTLLKRPKGEVRQEGGFIGRAVLKASHLGAIAVVEIPVSKIPDHLNHRLSHAGQRPAWAQTPSPVPPSQDIGGSSVGSSSEHIPGTRRGPIAESLREIAEFNLNLHVCSQNAQDRYRLLGHLGLGQSSKKCRVSLVPLGKCLKISTLPDQTGSSGQLSKSVSLQALLSDSARFGPKRLSRINKVMIGIKLASSVIQLCHTWWLRDSWSKKNIIFFYDPQKPIHLLATRPVIMRTFPDESKQEQAPSDENGDDNHNSFSPRNKRNPLFLLGLILWELWYGAGVEDNKWNIREQSGQEMGGDYLLWEDMSLGMVALQINYMMARDEDVLPAYHHVVKTCLLQAPESTDEDFIKKAWRKIVLPLENVYEVLKKASLKSS